MEIREVPVPFPEVESVSDEELVRNCEPDVADGKIVDEPAIRPVEQRDRGQRRRVAEAQRLAEVVEGQARVDDVLHDQDVAAGDLLVEVLQEADPGVAAGVGIGPVRGELDEVEGVRDRDRSRQVGDEDEARLQRRDEQRLAAVVVADDLAPELADARRQLLAREVDLADLVAARYEASSRRYRSARRSTSRL
jgi:hypothetical protein